VEQDLSSIQIWVFVPWSLPYDQTNWVEQILGEIVLPVMNEYSFQIDAVWMTRYIDSMSREPYQGLHQPFLRQQQDGQEFWRHVKLRFLLTGEPTLFKSQFLTLIREAGCIAPSGWQDYDLVDDLGQKRFVEPQASYDERVERAYLVFRFIDATTRLMLDAIRKDVNGLWHLEENEDKQGNPEGSFFQSLHHLFCNATNVPTLANLGFLLPSGNVSWGRIRVEF
jgi:hypothetical protein